MDATNTMRTFDLEIGATISLTGKSAELGSLPIGDHGVINIPPDLEPEGFQVAVVFPRGYPLLVVQKDNSRKMGHYHQHHLTDFGDGDTGLQVVLMNEQIEVMRVGPHTWTVCKGPRTNHIACWYLTADAFDHFQVGVITHDHGKTWRLHGQYRWRGQLFKSKDGSLVAKPDAPYWGPFVKTWKTIFDHSGFAKLQESVQLKTWSGSSQELNPPFPSIPDRQKAVMQWYSPYWGQTGLGIAIVHESQRWKPKPTGPNQEDKGVSVWVHGCDSDCPTDADGVKQLYFGDLLSFEGNPISWGTEKDGQPKLVGVKKLS